MSIGQATTPTFVCTVPDSTDLTPADNAVAAHSVSVYLTQRDTVWLNSARPVELQLNWTYSTGQRGMTKIKTVEVDRNLVPEVLQ